jgi:hypothetical protein
MSTEKLTKPQSERVDEKYGKMCDYYAHLLARCHVAVKNNKTLAALDPMGQKTSATTIFIRACARMDKSEATKETAENLIRLSEQSVDLSQSA